MISVGSSTIEDKISNFSNYGKESVQLFAPGSNIYSTGLGYQDDGTLNNSYYVFYSGTSMASPFVAGAAALCMAAHPNESYSEIRDRILNSVDPIPSMSKKCVTGGRINVNNLINDPILRFRTQPQSQVGITGGSVTFKAWATSGNITYQWYKGDSAIEGATRSSYTIQDLKASDAGSYKVIVSNGKDSVESDTASLSLFSPEVNASFVDGDLRYGILTLDGKKGTVAVSDNGAAGDLVIPGVVNHEDYTFTVTEVTNSGFEGNCDITSVIIPETITEIRDFAFRFNVSLTSAVISDSVTRLGTCAFSCSALETVTVGSGVTYLAHGVFEGMQCLKEVIFKGNAPEVEDTLFDDSENVVIYFNEGTTGWTTPWYGRPVVQYGMKYTFNIDNLKYTVLTVDYITKTGTVSVADTGSNVFSGDLVIPTTVEYNDYIFTVTEIADGAFDENNHITSVIIPETITVIGEVAFRYNTSLTTVVIPDNVTRINGSAFAYSSLETATVGSGVTYLGVGAFEGMGTLREIVFKGNAPEVDGALFNSSFNVVVYYNDGTTGWTNPWCDRPAYPYGTEAVFCIDNLKYTLLTQDTTTKTGTVSVVDDGSSGDLVIPETIEHNGYILTVTAISQRAFWHNERLRSVFIPNSVISIAGSAFQFCSNLVSITLPENLTSINGWTFCDCNQLQNITFPNNLTYMGDCAFQNCEMLTEVFIPSCVETIEPSAFVGCRRLARITVDPENLNYSSLDDVLFNKDQTSLILCPAGAAHIQDYVVPATVISIENESFRDSTSLTTVIIPDSVKTIGHYAFYNCIALKSVVVPASVEYLGICAFSRCYYLKRVYFEGNAPNTGSNVFMDSNRSVIYYNEGTTGWTNPWCGRPAFPYGTVTFVGDEFDNANLRYTVLTLDDTAKTGTVSVADGGFSGDLVIPETVIYENYVFTVTAIADHGFDGIESITSLVIPDTVTVIGASAFGWMSLLEELVIPDSVTRIGSSAFYQSSLKIITIGSGLTYLEGRAFAGTSYKEIIFNGDAPEAGYDLFGAFDIFGPSINVIVYYYEGTSGWTDPWHGVPAVKLTFLPNIITTPKSQTISEGKSATFSVKVLGVGEFSYQWYKDGIIIDGATNSTYTIRNVQFSDVGNYTVRINNENGFTVSDAAILIVDVPIIQNGLSYKILTLDPILKTGTVSVGYRSYSEDLENLIIPETVEYKDYVLTVTEVAERGFNQNRKITSVFIPDSVTAINGWAFFMCSQLQNVTFSKNLAYIGECAFQNCEMLTDVFIPASVKTIEASAFAGCSRLASITVDPENPNYSSLDGVLFNKDQTCLIFCSSGATHIKNYVIPDSVVSIANGAFYECTSLIDVVIPDSVKSIDHYAFYNCSGLTSLIIPASVEYLGECAFAECNHLTSVYFKGNAPRTESSDVFLNSEKSVVYYDEGTTGWTNPWCGRPAFPYGTEHLIDISVGDEFDNDSLKYTVLTFDDTAKTGTVSVADSGFSGDLVIPETVIYEDYVFTVTEVADNGFADNENITSLLVPDTVTVIGSRAFCGCQNIENTALGNNVLEIKAYAFAWNYKMKSIVIPDSVTQIGNSAFDPCFALEVVVIGESMNTLGDDVFHNCEKLKGVYFKGNAPKKGMDVFGKAAGSTIYYYEGTTGWTNPWCDRPTVELTYAPSIRTQPQSQTVAEGDSVIFRVEVIEVGEFTYQWYKDGTLIEGATGSSYTIASAQKSDAGSYRVTVINEYAPVASEEAILRVLERGSYANAILYYQYKFDSVDEKDGQLTTPDNVCGADAVLYGNASVANGILYLDGQGNSGSLTDGSFAALPADIMSSFGSYTIETWARANSGNRNWGRVWDFGNNDGDGYVGNGREYTFLAWSAGVSAVKYQWTEYQITATFPAAGIEEFTHIVYTYDKETQTGSLYVNGVLAASAVQYGDPTIFEFGMPNMWLGKSNYGGDPYFKGDYEEFRIYKGVLSEDEVEGNYAKGPVILDSEPVFESQPESQTIAKGSSVSFTIKVRGTKPMTYQWHKDGDPIDGATESSYTISNVQDSDAGSYTVTVTNAFGSETSEEAVLDVFENVIGNVFTVGYLKYTILSTDTVKVSGYESGIGPDLVVEASVNNAGQSYSVVEIGEGAFRDCLNLRNVVISDGITTIANQAFFCCRKLLTVEIPDSVVYIGGDGFYRCSQLVSAPLPSNITYLGDAAFGNCSSLKEIIIPETIKEIRAGFADNCSSLTNLVIGKNVTSIGWNAFTDCSSLTNVVIPEKVTFIGLTAFIRCTSLESVEIQGPVETIREQAFAFCPNLQSIYFAGDAPTRCYDNSFEDTDVTLYYNAGTTGWTNPWYGRPTILLLPDIFMGGIIYSCSTITGEAVVIGYEGTPVDVVIPEMITVDSVEYPVTTIAAGVFQGCTTLRSITFSENIVSIEDSAFQYCSGLVEVTIPESVKSLGEAVFASCINLETVYIGTSELELEVQSASFDEDETMIMRAAGNDVGLTIGDAAFQYDDKLKKVRMGKKVEKIGNGTFSGCESIEEISIPDSVTEVGDSAFENCTNLELVNIGANVETIGHSAFSGCESITEVRIPDSVTSLGESAFKDCSSLITVEVGNNVEAVGEAAFQNCASLTTVTVGENVSSIGATALSGCDSLSTVAFKGEIAPEGVAEALAEAKNTSTEETGIIVYHSDSVSWGEAASVIAETSNTKTEVSTTEKVKITEVNLNGTPLGVKVDKGTKVTFTVIAEGTGLFYQWYKNGTPISSATANVYEIESVALSDAGEYYAEVRNLGGPVYSDSLTLEVNPVVGDEIMIKKLIYRIESLDKTRKVGTVSVAGYVGVLSGTLEIPPEITLSSYTYDVIAIDGGIFTGCEVLKGVTIPSSIETIGDDVFAGCSALKSIYVDNRNEVYSSVGGVLFDKSQETLLLCPTGYSESTYIVPDGVTALANSAFQNCAKLERVTVSASVASVGNDAFAGCVKLIRVHYLGQAPNAGVGLYDNTPEELISYCDPENIASWEAVVVNGLWQGKPLVCIPVITEHPESQKVRDGETVIFKVTAIGSPLTYQWYKDGFPIDGATDFTYTIQEVTSTNEGSYTVTVSNAGGSETSEAAVLTVLVVCYHPADVNGDLEISTMELMEYANRWLNGDPDVLPTYLMSGANIWLNGGAYGYQADLEEPYCWVSQ